MNMSCVITDDEPNAINLLETFIHQVTSWDILGKCYNALEAIESVKEFRPDFIFLDINMPICQI
jgi:two-component system, LytTR family, response regulator